jgi:hypothetical protein
MEYIHYKDKAYPVRTFLVNIPDWEDDKVIKVSIDSLKDVLGDKVDDPDSPEDLIDSGIYFYLPDNEIELPAKDICSNGLDTYIELIEELYI